MKVLFVFSGLPPYMDALLNKISEKGVDLIAVVAAGKSALLGKGVKVVEANNTNYKILETKEKTSLLGKNYFPELYKIIENEKPNIIVAGWPYFLALSFQPKLRKIIKRYNIKFVIREIPFQTPQYGKLKSYFKENPMYDEDMNLLSKGLGFYIRQWLLMQLRRYCYKHADGSLVYSSIGSEIIPTYGIAKEKVFVTYNSGDSESLIKEKTKVMSSPLILPENPFRIIHIGRLVKWKRVDLLIDALLLILNKYPQAELLILGDGPERNNLEHKARALGIEKNVMFVGSIYKPAEIGAYLYASSVYVLAGMGGLSINDAMTYELPVICSVCDGTEVDLIEDGISGFFFKENDKSSLANKISKLFSDSEKRISMGKASFDVIENKINLDTVSSRYIEAFKNINS